MVEGWAGAVVILTVLALLDGCGPDGDEDLLIHFLPASTS